ncbi:MAG TPA: hypothetical protein VHM20_04605, partial [Gammaproteobacteria bacterium]|nr:hypothetical protein [Gammaproteobacteria bacterium]
YCEKVFNPQHVLRAFEMYDTFWENTPPTDTINYVKRALVWRQILGFAQRFLPACHAQDFAYGLYDIFVNKHSCLRTFNFRYDPNYAFFPLSGPRSGIGFDVAAISGSGRGAPYCLVRGGSRLCYEAYVEQKNQAWKEYEIQLNNKGRENKL